MSSGQSIRAATTWLFAGNMGGQLLQFAFGIILARLLSPADFGMLVTVQIFTGLAGYIAGGGMGQSLIRAREVEAVDFNTVFTAQLAIGVIIYFFFFAIAPLVATWFNMPVYRDLLRVSALSFVFRPLSNLPQAKLHREMRFKPKIAANFTTMAITSLSSISMAFAGLGVWSLVWGGLIGSIAAIFVLLPLAGWSPRLHWDRSRLNRHATYGFKVSTNDLIVYARDQASNFVTSHQLGVAAVGLFNKGDSLMRMPAKFISGSVYQTVLRAMSQEQDDLKRCRYIYYRALTLVATYTFPFYIGLWWAAKPFITFLYGANWVAAAAPLSILSIAGMLLALSMQSGVVAAAKDRVGTEMWIQIQILVVMLAGAYLGTHFGIIGVAWAVVVAAAFEIIRLTQLALKTIEGSYGDIFRALWPAVLVNGPMVVVLATTDMLIPDELRNLHPGMHLLALVVAGAISYAVSFLAFPPAALASESERWRAALMSAGNLIKTR